MIQEEINRLVNETTKQILSLPIERLEMVHNTARINHPLTSLMIYNYRREV